MSLNSIEIPVELKDHQLILTIMPDVNEHNALEIVDNALSFGEAKYQIKEGLYYSYILSDPGLLPGSE